MLVIIALPGVSRDELDPDSGLDAYADPEVVNNSDIGFFYKNEQLAEYRRQKRPDKANVIKMADEIVTTDFTKQDISIVPDVSKTYTGPTELVLVGDKIEEIESQTETSFVLKGGSEVSKEDSFKINLSTGVWGSNPAIPHKIEQVNKYYTAFTEKLQSVYFEFTSSNEFASIRVSELKGSVQYSLLDSDMKELKNGYNASDTIDVQWKGRDSATYYLKLTGSFSGSLQPFCVQLPSDGNEWMWQMSYTGLNEAATGKFDYYGDEDFFVIPTDAVKNINKTVISFTDIPADTNVVVYDKDRNVLAQYLQKKESKAPISLYSLENAYAVSVYSFDGKSSGANYGFKFTYVDTVILDIQTYGFALSPGYTDDEDYYTATVESLEQKQISEIMTAVDVEALTIKVSQQCGYEYVAKVGQDLELGAGRNVITISYDFAGTSRSITIVVSNNVSDVYYGYTKKGKKVFVVEDIPDNNYITVQEDTGKTVKYKRTELFTYVETDMPASYKEKIEALQAKYPNWKFTFVRTGYDFNTYVSSQDRLEGGVAVSAINGKRATREQIEYYVDPRNFLDEKNVFMFEKQTYTEGAYSKAGIGSIWVEKEAAVLPESTYVSYFEEAAKSAGISPYFITARAALESGNGTSKLAKGEITGCEGYYNFYGINAKDSNPSAGGEFAKAHDWNTRRRAIIEGAAWIKKDYIGYMQYSAYFMKFCFIEGRTWHQYMTDIAAPQKDAQSYYKAHQNGGTLTSEIEFVIPVFDNMP
ncbi:MAG: glucosaminidase domain-containing protein [Clostridia bacterium]|nr:glucosaminidase domain-containing protein [Clostridia bacterium]